MHICESKRDKMKESGVHRSLQMKPSDVPKRKPLKERKNGFPSSDVLYRYSSPEKEIPTTITMPSLSSTTTATATAMATLMMTQKNKRDYSEEKNTTHQHIDIQIDVCVENTKKRLKRKIKLPHHVRIHAYKFL